MSSTATQKTTEVSNTDQIIDVLRRALPVIVLCVIWVTFRPFPSSLAEDPGSSLFNQLGYSSLFALSFGILLTSIDRRVVTAMISLPWIILMVGLVWSTRYSPEPNNAMRAVIFSIIVTILAASFIALPNNVGALSRAIRTACFVVLGACYFGVLALPIQAIHQASELESQHAGFWRGLYPHKNMTGPVMAAIVFAGIYLVRRGMKISGIVITFAALVFVANTGSKTTLALVPAVAIMVLFPALMGMRLLSVMAIAAAAIVTHAFTIGTVYVPLLDDILRMVDDQTTFTGRIEIWEFSKPFLLDRLWTGFGYDGFWTTDLTSLAEQPFDAIWNPTDIIHGHNGFLDIAIMMGLPMMLVIIWAVFISPLRSYLKVPNKTENVLLADFFLMIVAFTVMNSALESFYFRRADPVWLTLVIAIFGLRLVSRFPLSRH